MMIWIVCGLMTLTAAIILAAPLLDTRKLKNESAFALDVYRDQLAEIGRDEARGLLTPEQARIAQIEIERRIIALPEAPDYQPARAPAPPLLAIMAVVLPLAGFGLYLLLGMPNMPGYPLAERPAMIAAAPSSPAIAKLEAAVGANPGDGKAWLALAQGYVQAQQPREAANAYAKAIALGANDAQTEATYGQMLVIVDGGQIGERALAAFQQALALDPLEPTARFFLALARAQAGDTEAALTSWLALERDSPPDAPWRQTLSDHIAKAAAALGKDPKTLPGRAQGEPAQDESAPDKAGQSDPKDTPPDQSMTPEQRADFIAAMVNRLALHLQEKPDDLEGWIDLARAYAALHRTSDAAAAWQHAAALAPARLDLQIEYAGALLEGREDLDVTLPDGFADVVKRIRTLDPENPLGLFYGGMVARVAGNPDAARALWQRLLALLPKDSPKRIPLQREIDALNQAAKKSTKKK